MCLVKRDKRDLPLNETASLQNANRENKVYLFSQGQPIARLLAYVTGWSKSIVLENKVFLNFDFRIGHLDHPLQSHSQI